MSTFELRATDPMSAEILRMWARVASDYELSAERANEALQAAQAMERWRVFHEERSGQGS